VGCTWRHGSHLGWRLTNEFSVVFIVYSSNMATTSFVVWFPKELLQQKNSYYHFYINLTWAANEFRNSISLNAGSLIAIDAIRITACSELRASLRRLSSQTSTLPYKSFTEPNITIFVEVGHSRLKVSSRNKHFGRRQSKRQQSVRQTVAFVWQWTLCWLFDLDIDFRFEGRTSTKW